MVSGIVTAVLLMVFVLGWAWAWSPRRRQVFEEAARLPLDDGLRNENGVEDETFANHQGGQYYQRSSRTSFEFVSIRGSPSA